jgi:hypothetical protein
MSFPSVDVDDEGSWSWEAILSPVGRIAGSLLIALEKLSSLVVPRQFMKKQAAK